MGALDRLKQVFGISAASQLPASPPAKVRPGQRSFPSFLKSVTQSETALPRTDRGLINKDILTYRTGGTTRQVMRDFASSSPDLSAAVFAYLRLAITGRYVAVAKNLDGTANPEATGLLQQILARFDVLGDYSQGFSGIGSMQSNSESLAKELMLYGGAAAELVLDKSWLPYAIQPLSVSSVDYKSDGKILRPVQKVGGTEIDLDIPTFFAVHLDQDLLDPYASSPMEPALKAALFSEDFAQDLHRVIKRVVHPRQKVSIDIDKFVEHMPADAHHDENKRTEYLNGIVSELESKLNGLKPEDTLVHFDTIEVSLDNNGNISLSEEYKVLRDIGNARLASGAKVLPVALGHEVGSSNVASTSSMLFVKNATVVKQKLDELYSRILTLAVRLFGHDVFVTFRYDDIDLRPSTELEAFRQTKQSRVLELLSLGMMSDEEACLELTGHLPPQGFKPLSGTMFKTAAAKAAGGTGPENDASTPSNGGSTLNQNLKSDQPAQGRGGNKKAEGETPIEAVAPNITVNLDVDASQKDRTAEIVRMKRDDDGNLIVERVRNVG